MEQKVLFRQLFAIKIRLPPSQTAASHSLSVHDGSSAADDVTLDPIQTGYMNN